MSHLPIPVRQMVLYKHGVGFFMREGHISGQDVILTFRHDEINDVLKSLAVFDRAGGQILGIHYQTPMDREDRLANSSINLSDMGSLRDLLRDLRGRQATFTIEITPGSHETYTGRIIGLDDMGQTMAQQVRNFGPISDPDGTTRPVVSLLTDDGQARFFKLSDLRAVQIQDDLATHDLAYFLDTAMSEDSRRSVALRLSEGEHQLVVNYVAPSPTWRVSYRIVAETDPNDKTQETGKALLQGWGLFDNRLEEDLEDVQVTLVAGQPISFIYDLYASRIPERPIVQDESRIAPGPIEYAAAKSAGMAEGIFAASAPADFLMAEADEAPRFFRKGAAPPTGMAAAGGAMQPAAEGSEKGEFFQYIVTAPVSVKRGESALVPIISAEVSYQRELLYNPAKFAKHPVAALRFKNSTGLTLERGPVTLVEDGDYKGEAVVAFTKDGNNVYLPYAVELGVHIKDEMTSQVEVAGLKIKDAYFIFDEYQLRITTTTIENTTQKPITVTLEAAMFMSYELFDTPKPDAETLNERRWRVQIGAGETVKFVRKERWLNHRREEVRQLDYKRLQRFMQNRWLDQNLFDRLSEMLDNVSKVQKAQAEIVKLGEERKTIYERQQQLRANLQALQPSGQEAALRNRMLTQLEASENRLEEMDRRIEELEHQITETEAKVNTIIENLGK
ncbi:MAG: hypothetical protein DPW16_20830 [Chloroflexi bacterium]|nr:hypothetical protein [Chloroflexota bacterium]